MFELIRGILGIYAEFALDLPGAHLPEQKSLVKGQELVSMDKQFLHNSIIERLFLVERCVRGD